jgi:hypothetical protein
MEELKPLEKKTSDGDCALTVLSFSGDWGSPGVAAGYFRVPGSLSGINPYICIGWAPNEVSPLVSTTPEKETVDPDPAGPTSHRLFFM